MTISPSSLAAVNGVGVKNTKFAVTAQVLPQKNVIIGTYDEDTYTTIVPNVPIQVFSAAQVGGLTGYGFMLHRLARACFKGGVSETWIIPQPEVGSPPAYAEGEIDFTGTTITAAGVIALYIAGDPVNLTVAIGDDDEDVADGLAAAINADEELPVTATSLAGVLTLTSKSAGAQWGDYIDISFNLGFSDASPAGLTAVITDMTGGAGTPDIQDALDALGTGDAQNEDFFTNLIHGYGYDTATLTAISTYNGLGNDFVGSYKKEISRPFRSLIGNTDYGAGKLADIIALTDTVREDRTNGVVCVPGSQSHPQEIAAQAMGVMAVTNSVRAQEGYINKALFGVWPGAMANRWTNDYDNRDLAVKSGISPTFVKNSVVYLQNVITFYRPADVSPDSNAYRAMRNISIIQNMLYNVRLNFDNEKWQGITIVENVREIAASVDAEKARDVDSVQDDLVALADAFAAKGWLYTASYTHDNAVVELRDGLSGFDISFPCILSGEGGIYNTNIPVDTSIAILT